MSIMPDSHRYAMLISSLPYHESLFGAKRAPLSRIRLRQRQHLLDEEDRNCLRVVAGLLEWSFHGMDTSDEEIVARAKDELPKLENAFARDLIVWRLELRTVSAALRRRHRGQAAPSAQDSWGYGRWLGHIRRHWSEPHFRLERVYPWLPEARTLLEADDTLGMERLLLSGNWDHLDRLADGHDFDFEAVLIYSLRWDLVARWTSYRGDEAAVRFEAMLEAGLKDVRLDDLISGSTCGDIRRDRGDHHASGKDKRETMQATHAAQYAGPCGRGAGESRDHPGGLGRRPPVAVEEKRGGLYRARASGPGRPPGKTQGRGAAGARRPPTPRCSRAPRASRSAIRSEQSGEMLSVALGPGLLGQVYDGLQNPLESIAIEHGTFLPRGADVPALDHNKKWSFVPRVQIGARLRAGELLGTVQEGRFTHKIMVPFDQQGEVEVTWIQEGSFTVDTPVVARSRPARSGTLADPEPGAGRCAGRWPRILLRTPCRERLYPDEPMITTQRLIDTFFPDRPRRHRLHSRAVRRRQDGAAAPDLAGTPRSTSCIVVACGERAGEVVETITEFPTAHRPADRRLADGPHHHHLQHLVDAGGGARGVDLHRHHAGRVLPADGLRRAAARRLHLALGPGHARDLGPPGGDPRRRGLPGLSRLRHQAASTSAPA